MRPVPCENGWMIHAPAKINLFFEVLGKRSDGFHEIVSLACPVSLYDTLYFESTESPEWTLEIHGESTGIPTDRRNIVIRVLEEFRCETGVRHGGRFVLVKRIPSQAGLGGGSSDAAAALLLVNRVQRRRLDRGALCRIGARVGSDVPLFLLSGGSLSRGRGEQVDPVAGLTGMHFVIVKPEEGLSTAEVYRSCMAVHDGEFRHVEPMLDALRLRNGRKFAQSFFNRLEVPAETLWPQGKKLADAIRQCGCPVAQMSGSGTAVFGLCRSATHARRAAAILSNRIPGRIFVVTTVADA